jgi:hypothetical protein
MQRLQLRMAIGQVQQPDVAEGTEVVQGRRRITRERALPVDLPRRYWRQQLQNSRRVIRKRDS